jgi:hypothetical protein
VIPKLHPHREPSALFQSAPPRAGGTSPAAALAPAVSLRADAVIDPATLRLEEAAAVKHNTFPNRPGYPSGMAHWQTHLHVEAWIQNVTFAKTAWADVHVFGHDGALVHSETCSLTYERPAGDGGDIFLLNCVVYEGATATPGSATPRPDVRVVQYRLYCELAGRVVTDGRLHECHLRSDASSS